MGKKLNNVGLIIFLSGLKFVFEKGFIYLKISKILSKINNLIFLYLFIIQKILKTYFLEYNDINSTNNSDSKIPVMT